MGWRKHWRTWGPEAGQYAEKAAAYKQDVRDAVLRATRKAAVVRLRDNTYIPYVPTRIHQRTRQFGPITTGYYSRYPEKIVPLYYFAAVREVFAGPILLLLRDVFHLTNHRRLDSGRLGG